VNERRSTGRRRFTGITAWLGGLLLLLLGCGRGSPVDSVELRPGRLTQGDLVTAVWLPVGMGEIRLSPADQARLANLGVTHLEWVQRAQKDSLSAEALTMDWCSRAGLRLPVYYEPPGYTPEDKLHDWARARVTPGFSTEVEARVVQLRDRWRGYPGFWGYLIGHEDYRREYLPALAGVVAALRQQDPERPAITVGRVDHYEALSPFLDALLAEGGEPNLFQHEQYVFRAALPEAGPSLDQALDRLLAGYDQVARAMQGRHGRWHAVVQVHAETRNGVPVYRHPSQAEVRLQAGLALSRGASGIVYFLYSSGPETVRDKLGVAVEERYYEGLVDEAGIPTASYAGVQRVTADLRRTGAVLASRRLHGGFPGRRIPPNPLLFGSDRDLEFGLFGDESTPTYLLVVNRRPTESRTVDLRLAPGPVHDAISGEPLGNGSGQLELSLEPGGWRLLRTGE
jgi:hypothetical protein